MPTSLARAPARHPLSSSGHQRPRRRRPPLPPTASAAAAAAASPLPLLPFFQLFRSQVARLEGVQGLLVPGHLAAAQCTDPPVSARVGSCNADRLRWGHFVYVTAGPQRGRGRRGDRRCSLAVLQGALLPPLFSFHPPLAFQVAAFDGGASWMVAVEYGTLAPSQQQQPPQQQAQPPQQQQGRRRGPGAASSGGKPRAGPGGGEAAERTPEAWQQAQLARLAAVRQLYSAAAALPDLAVPAPAQPQQQGPGALQPALLLLTSAAAEASGLNAAAALESVGLPGFQAALGLHLNGLAAAPADASPQHVQCMAAAQRAHAAQHAHRPLLCSAQLEAAFGREWLQELQAHLAAGAEAGLAAALQCGEQQEGQGQGQQQEGEWVYLDPALLRQALQGDS